VGSASFQRRAQSDMSDQRPEDLATTAVMLVIAAALLFLAMVVAILVMLG
jgi:uncharacterized protein (DUF983 family)